MKTKNRENELKKVYETPSIKVVEIGTSRMLAQSYLGPGSGDPNG